MIITFANSNELIAYLVESGKVDHVNKWLNKNFLFNNIEYSLTSFIEYLNSFNLITEKYLYQNNYNYTTKKYEIELKLSGYEFNISNFNLLSKNELHTNEINQLRLLSINECCTILSITRPTLYRLLNEGMITYYEILDQRKVKYIDLMDFINSKKHKDK